MVHFRLWYKIEMRLAELGSLAGTMSLVESISIIEADFFLIVIVRYLLSHYSVHYIPAGISLTRSEALAVIWCRSGLRDVRLDTGYAHRSFLAFLFTFHYCNCNLYHGQIFDVVSLNLSFLDITVDCTESTKILRLIGNLNLIAWTLSNCSCTPILLPFLLFA